jgi:hypothetical protein
VVVKKNENSGTSFQIKISAEWETFVTHESFDRVKFNANKYSSS